MAEEGTLCIREDVLKKAGAGAGATSSAEAYTNVYIKKVEGFISVNARYDLVTNYTKVSEIGKEFLRDLASSWAAIYVIQYNMSGFFSRVEYQTMLEVLWGFVTEGVNLIRNDMFRKFIISGGL
jgi:hypothetical protein